MLGLILRAFSYLFQFIASLALVGPALVALSSGHKMRVDLLPWTGTALTYWMLGLGLLGFVSIFLAVKGTFRWLFFLWTLVVLVLLVRGFFLSPYTFGGKSEFQWALLLVASAILSVLGGYRVFRGPAKVR